MRKCTRCGKHGLFLSLDPSTGLCKECMEEIRLKEIDDKKREDQREQQAALYRQKKEHHALELISKAKSLVEEVNSTTRFYSFMNSYSVIENCLKEASDIEDEVHHFEHIHGNVRNDYERLLQNKQNSIRSAIVRSCKNVEDAIPNGVKEFFVGYILLDHHIKEFQAQFDEETSEFAETCLKNLRKKCEIILVNKGNTAVYVGTLDFDSLEGHEFEYWCANLLRLNNYVNVEVTRGSGDQGVDIVAEKDGIRYAIQCKCYTSNLGNTPVQEVSAGKVFYKCHVGAVMTNRYFTSSAIELAHATGTLLWDRDKIVEFCRSGELIVDEMTNNI